MKRRLFLRKVLLAGLLAFTPSYIFAVTITDIVVPISGVTSFAANAINDRDQVVGFYSSEGVRHCFLWERGVFQTLDAVPATTGTTCYGINNGGQIVGSYLDSSGTVHDFLLDAGTLTEINTPGPAVPNGGINNRGQVVGTYQTAGTTQCFLWDRGVLQAINAPDITSASCFDLNEQGQIAGAFVDSSGISGSLLDHGVLTSIPLFLFTIAATSINDRGQSVGLFFDNSVTRGFFFDKSTPAPITLPVSDPLFSTVAINNSGDLVITFRSFGTSTLRMILVN